jgi:hypothetical protein
LAPVLPVRPERPAGAPAEHRPAPDDNSVAARTAGNLRAAYAQFIVNADTHEVIIRVKDANTDEILSEFPSKDMQAMMRAMKDYADTLARHRAAMHSTDAAL